MEQNNKLNVFISYSHNDEGFAEDFIKHIAPLKSNGLIEEWYDRKIVAGERFQREIDENLGMGDIICLLISANFLSSPACIDEKKKAFALKERGRANVVPIILSPCGWPDDNDISPHLALPTDGKPVSDYEKPDTGWLDVYTGFKKVVEKTLKLKAAKTTEKFKEFVQNVELLTEAHSKKEKLLLDDIFIYPQLSQYNELREFECSLDGDEIVEKLHECKKILIAGDSQSGKTTFCKRTISKLRADGYFPVYLSDDQYHGKIESKIERAFGEQYLDIEFKEVPKEIVIPIVDNFHLAKQKERHIEDLAAYKYQIVVVDDVFCLNLKDEEISKSFSHFKIRELSPLHRYELIKKWVSVSDKNDVVTSSHDDNSTYKKIDNEVELVNRALGKILGRGIMPAYPFFILSIISSYETFAKPIDQDITSQGYCYQTLIYMYLRKHGVKNEDVDTYVNFLTELAYFFYSTNRNEITQSMYEEFLEQYKSDYNLSIEDLTILKVLELSHLIVRDSFLNYHFKYPYIYYFFVAKYLADHLEKSKEVVERVMCNLHVEENAYVAVFLTHHSKNDFVLDEILKNADKMFEKYSPASLTTKELQFFDERLDCVVKALLPPAGTAPEIARKNELMAETDPEEKETKKRIASDSDDILDIELRKSIKTVEVMGAIIKNRAGSLGKNKLEDIFNKAASINLRMMTSFFDVIKHEDGQQEIELFIHERLSLFLEKKEEKALRNGKKFRKPSDEVLKGIATTIFWNTSFFIIYGILGKTIASLGSDKLIPVVNNVCDSKDDPAHQIVKHGILMQYSKNLQIDSISKLTERKDFSETSRKLFEFLIVRHCSLHKINYKDRQKITTHFGIGSQKLLSMSPKKDHP